MIKRSQELILEDTYVSLTSQPFLPLSWGPPLWQPTCSSHHLKSLNCEITCLISLPLWWHINSSPPASTTSHFLPFSLLPSPPTVFRRLSARPPSLLLPRWKVSHPEPRPRWPCWAQAPPCWPGMEAHTWRVLRTRLQPLALPACRTTSVGSAWREPGC